ncbi:MAG: hypothetical protein IJW45_03415 [Oscillospiraceae bacterium]|nr:hypothetical protein [Oscillospiraceae bacterium]
MKTCKKALALVLALMFILALCACGTNEEDPTTNDPGTSSSQQTDPKPTDPEQTEPSTTKPQDEVEYVYTVTVQDVDGAPISGVFVQVCAGESCVPVMTDENGVAGYVNEVTGDGELTAKIMVTTLPEGYSCVDGVEEISMADGNTDVVFVLEKDN